MTTDAVTYSTPEAAVATITTERQLHHWVSRHYVSPEILAIGYGRYRWSFEDLVRVEVLRHCVRKDLPAATLATKLATVALLRGEMLLLHPEIRVLDVEELLLISRRESVTALPLRALREAVALRLPLL